MTIKRGPVRGSFTTLGNDVFEAPLKPDAFAVWVYLLSKPDDWKVRPSQLRARFGIGKDKLQRIFRELEAYGVMRRDPVRRSGQFVEWDYLVTEHPQPENPASGGVDQKPENTAMADENADSGPEPEKPASGDQMPDKPAAGFTSRRKNRPLQSTEFLQSKDLYKTRARAWGEVMRLCTNWREAKARCSDPVVNRVVKAIGGWRRVGETTKFDMAALRAEFNEAWDREAAA